MTNFRRPLVLAVLAVVAAGLHDHGLASRKARAERSTAAVPSRLSEAMAAAYTTRILAFEANEGQFPADVSFLARAPQHQIVLTGSETALMLGADQPTGLQTVWMRLDGAAPRAAVAEEELPGKVNYLIGDDRSQWHTGVRTYRKVRRTGVYPGIDVVYYGHGDQLEYDFVVSPGARVDSIRLRFEGAAAGEITAAGELVLQTASGELRQRAPVIFQEDAGIRRTISGGFRLLDDGAVGFHVGTYDDRLPLIVDPVLTYSTYLGSDGVDNALAIATDAAGHAYVTGHTTSAQFPAQGGRPFAGGVADAFITKLTPDGTGVVFSTFLGGSTGGPGGFSGSDQGFDIAVDATGQIYVCGITFSSNFPVVNPFQAFTPTDPNVDRQADGFAAKLTPQGDQLIFSTYLGGLYQDQALGIAIDPDGNAYIAGGTISNDFPVLNAIQPSRPSATSHAGFITKLTARGQGVYSTYWGGTVDTYIKDVAADTAGHAYVTGMTNAVDLPLLNAYQSTSKGGNEAFVSRFDATGQLVYSTYLGASHEETAEAIAIGPQGHIFVTGWTGSSDFPTANAYQGTMTGGSYTNGGYEIFVTKFSLSGTTLEYSTFLGGSSMDYGQAIAVDSQGRATIAGHTTSSNFPLLDAIQATASVSTFVPVPYVAQLTAAGNGLVFSTYAGGPSLSGWGGWATGVAADTAGHVYVTGVVNGNLLITTGAFQTQYPGERSGFVLKISPGTASPCIYPPMPSSREAFEHGGPGSFVVGTTGSNCTWTAAADVPWITLTGATSGTGAGVVGYTVHANQGAARSGTITAGGQPFTVSQAGLVAPTISNHPANSTVSPGEGTFFSAWAQGNPFPDRQWQISSDGGTSWRNLVNTPPYSGVTGSDLHLSAVTVEMHGSRYRMVATNSAGTAFSNPATLSVTSPVSITAAPTSLRFGAMKQGASLVSVTPAQTVTLTFGGAAASWTAAATVPWLEITAGSGTGAGTFTVRLRNPSDVIGASTTLSGAISVSAVNASSAVTIPVTLTVSRAGAGPFGQVDSPAQNAGGVVGAIGVTGWAMDDLGVASVKIYRNCLPFENPANCQSISGHSVVFVGDAAFLSGARPDVESAFPTNPMAYRAGWGYLMMTSMLPHVTGQQGYGGQGPLTLFAFATDVEGHVTLLGRSSDPASPAFATPTQITMANDTIAKPFGAIDTPGQGATVSGVLTNFGWALTPDSNTTAGDGDILIPTDGSTMAVFIDGQPVAQVAYNQCRGTVGNPVPAGVYCDDDVANIFGNPTPQPVHTPRSANATPYRNLDAGRAAIGAFQIDTTTLTNALHTIAWSVTDSAGRTEGIGSRFFTVLNSGARPAALRATDAVGAGNVAQTLRPSSRSAEVAITGRSGFDLRAPLVPLVAIDGVALASIPELGRIELEIGGATSGFLVVTGERRDLPHGSSLDPTTGRFAWVPPAGYLGTYQLLFTGAETEVSVRIIVRPITTRAPGDAEIRMHLDSPHAGEVSGPLTVAGWALDPQAFTGSGIEAVHVWAFRRDMPLALPQFVGAAEIGIQRPDVAAAFGAPFHQAGFTLVSGLLEAGVYDILAYVLNRRTNRWEDARTATVRVR